MDQSVRSQWELLELRGLLPSEPAQDLLAGRDGADDAAGTRRNPAPATGIKVEIGGMPALQASWADWPDLAGRAAEPNIFQHPDFLAAAATAFGLDIHVILAWISGEAGERRLVGSWALAKGRPDCKLPVGVLLGPPVKDYAFLGCPVVDRGWLAAVMPAMLDAIAAHPTLPKIALLRDINPDGPVAVALLSALARRRAPCVTVDQRRRPMLASTLGVRDYLNSSVSSSTRKKLRQHRNRLAQQGPVELVSHGGADLPEAFEHFLQLEHAGWKGRAGTALLCRPADAAFAREVIQRLGAVGLAWIEGLHVDGRAIATQVMLRSGDVAFTWKIAHDDGFAGFSPGVLLIESYTGKLLSNASLRSADSCSFSEDGMMASLWSERATMVDLSFDVRSGGSSTFRLLVAGERLERWLRIRSKRALSHIEKRRAQLVSRGAELVKRNGGSSRRSDAGR